MKRALNIADGTEWDAKDLAREEGRLMSRQKPALVCLGLEGRSASAWVAVSGPRVLLPDTPATATYLRAPGPLFATCSNNPTTPRVETAQLANYEMKARQCK
jgi:hypothetical protein